MPCLQESCSLEQLIEQMGSQFGGTTPSSVLGPERQRPERRLLRICMISNFLEDPPCAEALSLEQSEGGEFKDTPTFVSCRRLQQEVSSRVSAPS